MMILHFIDRTYLRDTDQEKTNTFLPLDVSKYGQSLVKSEVFF